MAILRSSLQKHSGKSVHQRSADAKSPPPFTWHHLAANELSLDELEQCYKLVRRIKPLYIASGESWSRKEKLAELAETKGLDFILLRSAKNTILGFASFTIDDEDDNKIPSTFLWEIHLKPELQGRGIAKTMLERTCSLSVSGRVTLRVFSCNKVALQFYENFGFKKDKQWSTDRYYYLYWIEKDLTLD